MSEIELNLEAQAVELDEFGIGQLQVGAEQNDMRLRARVQIGLDNDDHVQGEGEFLVEALNLIDVCAQLAINGGLLQAHGIHMPHIDSGTILGSGTTPAILSKN